MKRFLTALLSTLNGAIMKTSEQLPKNIFLPFVLTAAA